MESWEHRHFWEPTTYRDGSVAFICKHCGDHRLPAAMKDEWEGSESKEALQERFDAARKELLADRDSLR